MLDIKFVRSNPDIVKENIKKKFQNEKLPLVDEVLELDKRNREIKQEVEKVTARPAQWWDKLIAAALGALASGIVAAVLTQILK